MGKSKQLDSMEEILKRREELIGHLEEMMKEAEAINKIMAQLPHDGTMEAAQVNLVGNGSEFVRHSLNPEGINAVYVHGGKSYEIRTGEIR